MVDHPRLVALLVFCAFSGFVLVLSQVRWFNRLSLVERLAPYSPGVAARGSQGQSFLEVMQPIVTSWSARATRLLGLDDDLHQRLHRAQFTTEPAAFRMRQFAWSGAALLSGLLAAVALRTPVALTALITLGAPILAFLLIEQQLITAGRRRQQRIFVELPVITEQLAMLISAGYSMGAAIAYLAKRGTGTISHDLASVHARVGQGLTVEDALREWAEATRVPELERLVSVLSLSAETNDLGRLIAEESCSVRAESQRRLSELIDKRTEQVWIPVTVATLVPGLIFLAIPFMQALRLFSAG